MREIILAAGIAAIVSGGCVVRTVKTTEKTIPYIVVHGEQDKIKPNLRVTINGKQYDAVGFNDGSMGIYLETSVLYRIGEARILKTGKDLKFFNCTEQDALFDKRFSNFRGLLEDKFLEEWKTDYLKREQID